MTETPPPPAIAACPRQSPAWWIGLRVWGSRALMGLVPAYALWIGRRYAEVGLSRTNEFALLVLVLLGLLWGAVMGLLVFPIGLVGSVRCANGILTVDTVGGRRVMRLRGARARRVKLRNAHGPVEQYWSLQDAQQQVLIPDTGDFGASDMAQHGVEVDPLDDRADWRRSLPLTAGISALVPLGAVLMVGVASVFWS